MNAWKEGQFSKLEVTYSVGEREDCNLSLSPVDSLEKCSLCTASLH